MICKNDVCKFYDENWPNRCKQRPDTAGCGSFLKEPPLKAQAEPVSEVPCSDRVILQADIAYHSHPYATCPYCGEEEEVAGDDCGSECSFCHKTYKYSLEI